MFFRELAYVNPTTGETSCSLQLAGEHVHISASAISKHLLQTVKNPISCIPVLKRTVYNSNMVHSKCHGFLLYYSALRIVFILYIHMNLLHCLPVAVLCCISYILKNTFEILKKTNLYSFFHWYF